jgi:hypothetical protein
MMLDKRPRRKTSIRQYHLIDAFGSWIAASNVWFIQGMTSQAMRDNRIRKVGKNTANERPKHLQGALESANCTSWKEKIENSKP